MTADVSLSISQFRNAWRVFCTPCPGAEMLTDTGVEYIFSGLPIAFFNVAVLTDSDISGPALEACAGRAREWAATRHAPWLFVLTHDALQPDVDGTAVLDGCGFVPMLPLTGMRATAITAGARQPDDLRIEVAMDDASCVAAFDVNAAAYAADLDASKAVYGRRAFWDDHVLSVGRTNGRATTSAAVLMVDGYRYVALVATLPDHQRRGYADAVMRHALEVSAARFGSQPTTLHATDAGRPIYARMGYEPLAHHTAFIDRAWLEAH